MITPEPAEICGCACPGRPKKRRKNGSRSSGFWSSGLRCRTAMLTTAGVTFSSTGASVGTPSRSGRPGIWAKHGAARSQPASSRSLFIRFAPRLLQVAHLGVHRHVATPPGDELLAVVEIIAAHGGGGAPVEVVRP